MKAAFLAAAVLATAGVAFYFGTAVHAAKASGPGSAERRSAERRSAAPRTLSSTALPLPLFFEPNQGQTAPQVKFLARGAGYGLFLTADEAVLELQHSAFSTQHSVPGSQLSAVSSQPASSSVIRMRLEGAHSSARVSGASPLPGKSNYFIGNDPSKWHHDIPQFGRVEYESVYPGVDLVYYGDQGQLEYDFRVAPAADPNQIALSFKGASAHIDSGDLILSTDNGDVRFHAPHVYQPAAPQSGNAETVVAGGFRQLADNRIGFTIGDYDHTRELVIDPTLSYSTYLGGSGTEALVKVAVDGNGEIYVAGSTDSPDFPVTTGPTSPPGAQNIFISKINTSLTGTAQLVYSIYLGGSQKDFLAGIAVDSNFGIYVAGWTTSSDFPTANAFQSPRAGTHGFLSKLTISGTAYALTYSTYLAGNGIDTVTGLAIDNGNRGTAYVTGWTTSSDDQSNGFPANPDGFQLVSHSPGNKQFFASKLNTSASGPTSMVYSTYFGGGNPVGAEAIGGGIAVDLSGASPNMYITGATNMLPVTGASGEIKFQLVNAEQSCLDEAGQTACTLSNPTALDAFVAKINPNTPGLTAPVYSTYVGGSGDDVGTGIAVDSSANAYITGSTFSTDFIPTPIIGLAFQPCLNNTLYTAGNTPPCATSSAPAQDAFIAKIDNQVTAGAVYPLNYATYIGGSGDDSGQGIQVDPVQGAHVVGSTSSPDLPITQDALQNYGLNGDAFVALILTTETGRGIGDYLTYLGGNQLDQGTGIALDNVFGATYVAGTTLSPNFPVSATPYQLNLNNNSQDAFVSKIGATSTLTLAASTSPASPAPNPVSAGTQVAFTYDITNTGTDTASQVVFTAVVPTGALVTSSATAKVIGGTGSCGTLQQATISCFFPTLAVNAVAKVEVDVTPNINANLSQISVSATATANNSGVVVGPRSQTVPIVDFGISASTPPAINAGDTATIQVTFAPNTQYSATITPTQTTSPSMVTATTPTFNPTTVALSGSASATTTLSIATVARPVTTGSLLRRGSFYAAWLPIGGLSLVGLGITAGRKRRRWLAGAVLGLIAGVILLQPGCGSSSSSTTTTGGTQAATYTITITGSAAAGASHNTQVQLVVH
jgi:uncharacterized repeat protein (TIGR01451 family)